MIFHYQPLVSWPFFFGILFLLIVIGFVSFFFQWKRGIAPSRLLLRILLFIGFLVCLSMSILRPDRILASANERLVVYQDGMDKSEVDRLRDSLEIKKAIPLSKYKAGEGQVVLLGDRLSKQDLYPFRNLDFQWILPQRHGLIENLSWKGYLRKGEIQRIGYRIFADRDSSELAIAGADPRKISLQKGWNEGLLQFHPSGLGRAEFPLVLDQDSLATVRFFIGASQPKRYHFQFGFPSAESRTLSSWLQEEGETVSEDIRLSRETFMQSGRSSDSLQIYMIDPAQLDQRSIQDAVKFGSVALVVMNVSQPAETAQKLNRLFGTDFQVTKTGGIDNRKLEGGVEALPFAFAEKTGQKLLQDRSVALQFAGSNPIVLSLISASYPLVQQGKKENYESVWGGLLELLEPDEISAWRLVAPVISGISEEIKVFRKDILRQELIWNKDTVTLGQNAVNPYSASGNLRLDSSGWVDLDSGFSVFAYGKDELPGLHTSALIQEIRGNATLSGGRDTGMREPISPWIWMVGMLMFLGFLWLEPKLAL
jgi:hypothetical protein